MPRKPPSTVKSGKKVAGKAVPGRVPARPARPRPAAGAAPRAPAKGAKPPPKPGKVAAPKAAEAVKPPVKAGTAAATGGAAPAPPAKGTPAAILAAKALKKARAAKKAATPKAAPRLKIVWAVCDHTLKTIKTFPYPERRAAELEASRLQKAKGKEHLVRAERVPMTSQPEARR